MKTDCNTTEYNMVKYVEQDREAQKCSYLGPILQTFFLMLLKHHDSKPNKMPDVGSFCQRGFWWFVGDLSLCLLFISLTQRWCWRRRKAGGIRLVESSAGNQRFHTSPWRIWTCVFPPTELSNTATIDNESVICSRASCIHRVKWRHRVCGHETIAILRV